jgi:hypothetical protein
MQNLMIVGCIIKLINYNRAIAAENFVENSEKFYL